MVGGGVVGGGAVEGSAVVGGLVGAGVTDQVGGANVTVVCGAACTTVVGAAVVVLLRRAVVVVRRVVVGGAVGAAAGAAVGGIVVAVVGTAVVGTAGVGAAVVGTAVVGTEIVVGSVVETPSVEIADRDDDGPPTASTSLPSPPRVNNAPIMPQTTRRARARNQRPLEPFDHASPAGTKPTGTASPICTASLGRTTEAAGVAELIELTPFDRSKIGFAIVGSDDAAARKTGWSKSGLADACSFAGAWRRSMTGPKSDPLGRGERSATSASASVSVSTAVLGESSITGLSRLWQ